MHNGSILRMQWFVENYSSKLIKDKIKVLDVGSHDVNGSFKPLFVDEKYEYIGLDMEAGSNVDIVLRNPYDWNELKTDNYDIVISGQAFEHIEFFWITISEMARVLKKDGLLCIIAPSGFAEHRYPVDCYRFFTDGMVALARYVSLEILHAHTNCGPNPESIDWYNPIAADSVLIAKKSYYGPAKYVNLKTYVCVPPDHVILRTGLVPYMEKKTLVRSLKKVICKILGVR
jgi:SAM-dependent methyltransferase